MTICVVFTLELDCQEEAEDGHLKAAQGAMANTTPQTGVRYGQEQYPILVLNSLGNWTGIWVSLISS